jgi:hypothetical protein
MIVIVQRHWWPWAFFIGLTLAILGPLLAPGYILTLDLSWTPHLPAPSLTSNTALLWWALRGLAGIIPSWVVEKLLLITIFVTAGIGMYRLAAERAPGWPAYISGTLYVVNPFTYERLMAGQWLVLAGYAVMPGLVWAGVRLLERPGLRRGLVLGVWLSALGLISLHAVAMAVLVLITIIGVQLFTNGPRRLRPAIGWLGLAAGLGLSVNSFWSVPLALHRSPTAVEVASFSTAQFQAFRTASGPAGAPANIFTLQGFWGERTRIVIAPSSVGWSFWLISSLVLAGVGYGLWVSLRRRDRLGLALAISGLVAAILAIGVAWGPLVGLTQFLVDHVPFYRGYREPEKWVAVVALAYAYLIAMGLRPAFQKLQGAWRDGVGLVGVIVVVLWIPMMPWGASGQLVSTDYPTGWYAVDARLSALPGADPGKPDVLILPWHQYMTLDFAHRPVANPANGFFARSVVISDDPELPGVLPSSQGMAAQIQSQVIDRRFFDSTAGTKLASLGIHYLVLLKVADWQSYAWLDQQAGLSPLVDTPDYTLYLVYDEAASSGGAL